MTPEEEYQRAMQEQQSIQLARGSYISPQDKYAGAITSLTDPTSDLDKFRLKLRSQRYEYGENAEEIKIVQVCTPLINEKGINAIMTLIESVVHQTNSMTNFDKNYLAILYDTIKFELVSNLMKNRLAYEIERKNRDVILGSAMNFIWGFVLKSFEEGERKFWKGTTQEIRHMQQVEQTGGIRSFNPFKWGKNK